MALIQEQVSQLYVAIFNRASEGEGNSFWQPQPDMATAATAMLDTDAARNYFGGSLNSNRAFIEHIYINTLSKTYEDDPDGINYWTGLLDSGENTRGEVVAIMVGVIKDYAPPQYPGDPGGLYYDEDDHAAVAAYHQFTNRVEVCSYMADNIYATPPDWETATAFDKDLPVTDDMETVLAAKSHVERLAKTTVSIDAGTLESAAVIDAFSNAFHFTDDAAVSSNVVITNFSSDDTISISNADAGDYAFANDGADVTVSYNYNDEGIMNIIQLTGVVSSEDLVYDQTSFVAAIGFDPFAG